MESMMIVVESGGGDELMKLGGGLIATITALTELTSVDTQTMEWEEKAMKNE
jgi:hypothetical protein